MRIHCLCFCVGILICFRAICFDVCDKYCNSWTLMLCTCHYVVLCHNDVTHSAAVAPMPLHADCCFLAQSISGENSTKCSIYRSCLSLPGCFRLRGTWHSLFVRGFYVQTATLLHSGLCIGYERFDDFICCGSPRCGSGWDNGFSLERAHTNGVSPTIAMLIKSWAFASLVLNNVEGVVNAMSMGAVDVSYA